MTKLILNGANGKMGKTIIELVKTNEKNFNIVYGVDKNTEKNIYNIEIYNNFKEDIKTDVIIDFSNPDSLESVLSFYSRKRNGIRCIVVRQRYPVYRL